MHPLTFDFSQLSLISLDGGKLPFIAFVDLFFFFFFFGEMPSLVFITLLFS